MEAWTESTITFAGTRQFSAYFDLEAITGFRQGIDEVDVWDLAAR